MGIWAKNLRTFRVELIVLLAVLAAGPRVAAQAPQASFQTLYTFGGASQDGAFPESSVVIRSAGMLYGTTYNGGIAQNGTVYSLTPPQSPGEPWTETLLYLFQNGSDGAWPTFLIQGPDGVLYGLTDGSGEGLPLQSTAFSLTPPAQSGGAWTLQTIYEFTNDILSPSSLLFVDGVLYGTSLVGGHSAECTEFYGCGTVFSLSPATPGQPWNADILFSFPGGGNGGNNNGQPVQLVPGPGGSFYGITAGPNLRCPTGCGEVFLLMPPSPGGAWTETVLYVFTGLQGDGSSGVSLALGPDGALFGATAAGGLRSGGTIFSLRPPRKPGAAWKESVLHRFGARNTDGLYPTSGLVIGAGGVIYGTTSSGRGPATGGIVFSVAPPAVPGHRWPYSVLRDFAGNPEGAEPVAGLALGDDATLFGTTALGGMGFGTVFELQP